jgi:hypothetical protein
MESLRVEPDPEVRKFSCVSCGIEYRRVFGYVYEGDRAFALYRADLYQGHLHADRSAVLTLSVGDWSEEADPRSRQRVRIQTRSTGDRIEMTFVDFDPNEQPEPILGRLVDAGEARVGADTQKYFRVADAVVAGDARVQGVLGARSLLS